MNRPGKDAGPLAPGGQSPQTPMFSVVVPAYDAAATLAETLDAVASQAFDDWECVVVDDGSSDGTLSLASSYVDRDPRFRVIHQDNQGSAGAYNTGVAAARGSFIVLCSADDVLLPEHLTTMAGFIGREPAYDIYSSNGYYWTPESGTRDPVYGPGERDEIVSLRLEDVIRNCFYGVGAAYRRELAATVGGYRREAYGEDYDFWLRAMARGARHRYLPEALSLHRISDAQKTADRSAVYRSDIRIVSRLRRDFPLTTEERRAVAGCLRDRLGRLYIRPLSVALLGDERTTRFAATATALAARGSAGARRAGRRVAGPAVRSGAAAPAVKKTDALKVLLVASWFPSADAPVAGIFVRHQAEALAEAADVAVLSIREARAGLRPQVTAEDGLVVARAQLRARTTSRTASGRAVAALLAPYDKVCRYRRAGLEAFESLRGSWGAPDIVHVQALWPAALIAHAIKRRYGIPYVVTEHSEEYLAASGRRLVRTPGVVPLLLRPLARGAARTIAVSRALADRLTGLGLTVHPVVIPNVVPLSAPAQPPAGPPHVIAHISIMGPAKNLEALLHAADRLRRRRADFVLRLTGDGELRADLERLAATLGLGDAVRFTGPVSPAEVPGLLAESAFTVVSSTHETFSTVAAQSLMCGRPVLSTRCGGPEEFITPEVGRLVPAGSVAALVDGLDWMLDHVTEFDADALHRYAAARFAPDVVAARITEVYRDVLRDR